MREYLCFGTEIYGAFRKKCDAFCNGFGRIFCGSERRARAGGRRVSRARLDVVQQDPAGAGVRHNAARQRG